MSIEENISLYDEVSEAFGKTKDFSMINDAEFDVQYPTGFLSLDFLNGTVKHVEKE